MRHFALTLALAGLLSAVGLQASLRPQPLQPMQEHTETTKNIVEALASRHYLNTQLDDSMSGRILDAYIDDLDPTKGYFLQSDIDEFQRYRNQLDNTLLRGDLGPAFAIYNRFQDRVVARFEKTLALLDKGLAQFDFTVDEELPLDPEEQPWARSEAELDELWRKRVKNDVLNLQLSGKEADKLLELVRKRYKNRLDRTLQTNSEDVYQLYMNSFSGTYDPHTQYFSPRTSENFNINMSLSLEGIGAVLQREDEFTKVVELVPAGPAEKSGLLKPDDRIIGVGQGPTGELVDVIGWRLDEVVDLIRGRKNSIVRLEIIPKGAKDDATRVIQITRNKVQLEEQSAKSQIIEINQFGHVHKIGVIEIPTFYVDFQALQRGDKDYKSTTRDVRQLLQELKAKGIEGLVLDLRDNGGGSLQEANSLTGLFINRGPTVQIRTKTDRVELMRDLDSRTVYDGPLAVLVNRLSASASEIVAGAIQDYQRGIVLGSQTFGKGTVQSLIPLNRGQLKMTQAKFYRISGESTQHQGIIPDITFPENYDITSIGENTLESPLPWDKISATTYRPASRLGSLVSQLRANHLERASKDPEFIYLQRAHEYSMELSKEKSVSLNRETREKFKEDIDAHWLALENDKRVAEGLPPLKSLDELDAEASQPTVAAAGASPNEGTAAQSAPEEEAKAPDPLEQPALDAMPPEKKDKGDEKDAYVIESGNILLDIISLGSQTAVQNPS